MASVSISGLPLEAAPLLTDLMEITHEPDTAPTSKKLTLQGLRDLLWETTSLQREVIDATFFTIEALEASTTALSVGTYVTTYAEKITFVVVATGGALVTAGDVHLDPVPGKNGVDVRAFGARGDSATDDTSAFNAAVVWAGANGNPVVFVPPAAARTSGENLIRGFYRLTGEVALLDNSHVEGAGQHATELRWTTSSNGFATPVGSLTSNWTLRGLHIRGVADTTSSSLASAAVVVNPSNYFTMEDLFIQRFVDGVVFDASTIGLAIGTLTRVAVVNSQQPNTVNGFPRYGFDFRGGTKKPQGLRITDCVSYAELNVADKTFTANGVLTDFDLPGLGGLFLSSGVQVYTKAPDKAMPTRAVEGTDYDLMDITSGFEVAVTPGTVADSDVTSVRVSFRTPPAASDKVYVIYNDPTGLCGVNLATGTGNTFKGLLVGGWYTNAYINDSENTYAVSYQQIAMVGLHLTAAASSCHIERSEYPNKNIVEDIVLSGSPPNITATPGAGRAPAQLAAEADHAASGVAEPVVWDTDVDVLVVSVHDPLTSYDVDAAISYAAGSATDGAVEGVFTLEASDDEGSSWVQLDTVPFKYAVGGATSFHTEGRALLRGVLADGPYNGSYSVLHVLQFRVIAQLTDGDTLTVLSTGSVLRAEPKNPS